MTSALMATIYPVLCLLTLLLYAAATPALLISSWRRRRWTLLAGSPVLAIFGGWMILRAFVWLEYAHRHAEFESVLEPTEEQMRAWSSDVGLLFMDDAGWVHATLYYLVWVALLVTFAWIRRQRRAGPTAHFQSRMS